MGKRLAIGFLKGATLGVAVGALFHFALGMPVITAAWINYLLYGGVGALAGALSGKAPWKPGAWIASVLKGLFGVAMGCGLYALAAAFLKGTVGILPGGEAAQFSQQPLLFAPALAVLYAVLVELDDGGDEDEPAVSGVRVGAAPSADVDEDEAPAKAPAARRKDA